jgi:hypothetical protein
MPVRSLIEELKALLERPQTPPQVKHCVAKVAPKFGGDTSKAFAICVSKMQKAGEIKKGSTELTKKGKKAAKAKSSKKSHGSTVASYEKLLKKAREE